MDDQNMDDENMDNENEEDESFDGQARALCNETSNSEPFNENCELISEQDDSDISVNESIMNYSGSSLNRSDVDDLVDPDFEIPNVRPESKKYNTISIDELVLIAERLSIDTSVVTGVANAMLACLCKEGFVDVNGNQEKLKSIPEHLMIDPKKITRSREKSRVTANEVFFESLGPIQGIMVDGKHEFQRTIIENGKKVHRGCEMLTIVRLPQQDFLGCVPIENKAAETQCKAIIEFFKSHNISLQHLKDLTSDGEVANTGFMGGLHRLLQVELNQEIQLEVCELHLLEILMKVVFKYCNNGLTTSSGTTFIGPIGKHLQHVQNYSICDNFSPISCGIELEEIPLDTSNDQKYLISLAKIISSGVIPSNFSPKSVGPLNNARWNTAESRMMLYYISQRNPSQKLKILIIFIMKVNCSILTRST